MTKWGSSPSFAAQLASLNSVTSQLPLPRQLNMSLWPARATAAASATRATRNMDAARCESTSYTRPPLVLA